MSKTKDNLMTAFAGESQANRKYLAYAKKAEEEGYTQVARLFRAAAHAETVHALAEFREAGCIGSTAENLKAAAAGEHYEAFDMYPPFQEQAEAEGERKAATIFRWAKEAEKVHEDLYREALETLGKDEEEFDYYVCPVCGYTHKQSAPDKCPICGAPASRFEVIH